MQLRVRHSSNAHHWRRDVFLWIWRQNCPTVKRMAFQKWVEIEKNKIRRIHWRTFHPRLIANVWKIGLYMLILAPILKAISIKLHENVYLYIFSVQVKFYLLVFSSPFNSKPYNLNCIKIVLAYLNNLVSSCISTVACTKRKLYDNPIVGWRMTLWHASMHFQKEHKNAAAHAHAHI